MTSARTFIVYHILYTQREYCIVVLIQWLMELNNGITHSLS